MEEQTFNLVGQYGALGLFAIIAVYMIKNMINESALRDEKHATEREAWRTQIKEQHDEMVGIFRESVTNQSTLITLITAMNGRLKKN